MTSATSAKACINSSPTVVLLRDFYNGSANLAIPTLPGKVFIPDEWTETIAAGVQKLDMGGKNVLEVGVGSGINAAGILTSNKPPASFIGTDICRESITLSQELINNNGWNAVCFCSDLLKDVPVFQLSKIDEIFACIPQVPASLALEDGDNTSHYYIPTGGEWDIYGLGLNANLIQQATERAPQAGITLNLCGRPGKETLERLFETFDRNASIIHEAVVPQHIGTSLASLAKLEDEGHTDFEFFADPKATQIISATTAEQRRISEQPVFHKVYVFHAPGLRNG